jgi:hypothetical protein
MPTGSDLRKPGSRTCSLLRTSQAPPNLLDHEKEEFHRSWRVTTRYMSGLHVLQTFLRSPYSTPVPSICYLTRLAIVQAHSHISRPPQGLRVLASSAMANSTIAFSPAFDSNGMNSSDQSQLSNILFGILATLLALASIVVGLMQLRHHQLASSRTSTMSTASTDVELGHTLSNQQPRQSAHHTIPPHAATTHPA